MPETDSLASPQEAHFITTDGRGLKTDFYPGPSAFTWFFFR